MTKRIGVLLSGRGSNFEALADSIAAGRIPDAQISIVVSNREDAPGLARADGARHSFARRFRRRASSAKPTTAWWSRRWTMRA